MIPIRHLETVPSGITTSILPLRDRLSGGFDGSFVALLPEEVHPPRDDAIYDRDWGGI
jgi:hypothetical protein